MSDVSTRNTTTPTLTRPVLVYDGECRFCAACVRFVRRRTRRPLRCVAFQEADLGALGLTREQCEAAVQWVGTASNESAHMAVAAALCHARAPWPVLGAVVGAPGVRRLAARVYRRVAARRRCAVHPPADRV